MANARGKRKDRLLFLLQQLIGNTDDEHKMSRQELSDCCAASGHGKDPHMIGHDMDVLCSYGFDIITTTEGRKKYYNYGSRDFDVAELRTLIDAVALSLFISPQKTKALMEKIAGLSSRHDTEKLLASVYTGNVPKANNYHVFLAIDMIHQAINKGKKIMFQQYRYDGYRKQIMQNNGEVYTVSPYLTIWKNDRYFLLGWDGRDAAIRTFRIDRMAMPMMTDEPAHPCPEAFEVSKSRCFLTDMDGRGIEMSITLVCDDALMNNVVDQFGDDFPFERADCTHFRATVNATSNDAFWGWVFSFAERMRVEAPMEAKAMYQRRLRQALVG